MNKKAIIGIVLALLPAARMLMEALGIGHLAPFLDVLPDVLGDAGANIVSGLVGGAGVAVLAKADPVGKK